MTNRRARRKPATKRPPASRKAAQAPAASADRDGFRVEVPTELAEAWQQPQRRSRAQSAASTVPHGSPSPVDAAAENAPRGLEGYVARNAPQVVAATYWFEPPTSEVTVRLTGRRLDVTGRPGSGDSFQHDEQVAGLVAGSGPVSVTAKVRGVNPGSWTVDARAIDSAPRSPARRPVRPADVPVHRARWSWRRWRLSEGPSEPVQTCKAPFAPLPAVIMGSWAAFVLLGILAALVIQSLVLSALELRLNHVLTVSVPTVLAGAIGGKAWYVLLHRRTGRRQGWAVQGFVTGVILVAPPLLALMNVPVGPFLDTTAPGLLFGLAIGRLGCFFSGCCAGRATASRWGVWSSNRRVGARRIPTQLLESALAAAVGLAVLLAVLTYGPRGGGWFVAAVAAYTLIRQTVLQLREERRQSRRGSALVAGAAATVLVADVAAVIAGLPG